MPGNPVATARGPMEGFLAREAVNEASPVILPSVLSQTGLRAGLRCYLVWLRAWTSPIARAFIDLGLLGAKHVWGALKGWFRSVVSPMILPRLIKAQRFAKLRLIRAMERVQPRLEVYIRDILLPKMDKEQLVGIIAVSVAELANREVNSVAEKMIKTLPKGQQSEARTVAKALADSALLESLGQGATLSLLSSVNDTVKNITGMYNNTFGAVQTLDFSGILNQYPALGLDDVLNALGLDRAKNAPSFDQIYALFSRGEALPYEGDLVAALWSNLTSNATFLQEVRDNLVQMEAKIGEYDLKPISEGFGRNLNGSVRATGDLAEKIRGGLASALLKVEESSITATNWFANTTDFAVETLGTVPSSVKTWFDSAPNATGKLVASIPEVIASMQIPFKFEVGTNQSRAAGGMGESSR
mmetsp:Transcript_23629/g.53296  ORF Transcript_23629/g.53296 Transcript_23629/m.53296 type:complete len:415 (+) Transcript_23629:181-1425(+)|eukprot:CAMPEP_0172603618 /NCGR_PEP_ID=MMETSP1068-20121228/23879_1 /TAXON_ID=35684 /ORGANISM="Pseudopedinella elastica, Strain CCMP716" /LENGTH=414 /DNA_ID=CAMNT_0013405427 /DNA_START=153 /DNA_END=1397 /DNA_ORIENTATION=-